MDPHVGAPLLGCTRCGHAMLSPTHTQTSTAESLLMHNLPLFNTAGSATGHSGLDLLAVGAGAKTIPPSQPRFDKGPFNPAASLPLKVVKRILDLEFVEIVEVLVDEDTPTNVPDRPPTPPRHPIDVISRWVERFSLMAAVLSTRFTEKAPEFFAYQATIVRADRNYEGKRTNC